MLPQRLRRQTKRTLHVNTVSNDDITDAFHVFCKVQGLDPDRMANCYEFSMFIGFRLLNVFRYINNDKDLIAHPNINRTIDALNGPHGEVVVRVWMARRYSFLGKLKACCKKPTHRLGFMCISFAVIIQESFQ